MTEVYGYWIEQFRTFFIQKFASLDLGLTFILLDYVNAENDTFMIKQEYCLAYAVDTRSRNLCKSSGTRNLHVCQSNWYKFFLVQVSCMK